LKINRYLAKIPLFKGLPENQLNDLSRIVIEQVLKRGAIIFSEGDEGKGFYIVAEGRVKIYKLSSEGKEKILHIFGPGEPFGEVPVFAGQHFPANAETLEKCRVLFLPRNRLIEQIEKNPPLALNMLAILSTRLRQFTVQIEHLSLKEVPGRLAAYLLYSSDREGGMQTFRLDITKGQLASLLGTIPETLSRIFSKMSKQGLIDVSGPHISILDREGLEELAETAGSM